VLRPFVREQQSPLDGVLGVTLISIWKGGSYESPTRSIVQPFGKDADKRLRLFKDIRTLLAPVEPLFLEKLSNMTITLWQRASRYS
jgi:hypothetical protein